MKSKKVLIIIGVVVFLMLVGGGYLFLANKSSQKPIEEEQVQVEEVIPTIMPDELGLTMTARSDGKAIKFEIKNIQDIASIDYEISYLAKGNIPRGAIGTVKPKVGETKLATNYIELGSCSSGKCKYDEGVTSVKLILKVTKTNDQVYQTEKTLEL